MKRYVKPDLVYESFELSQSVATCTWNYNSTYTSPDSCKASNAGVSLFTNDACDYDDPDSYCITNGTHSNSVFNS